MHGIRIIRYGGLGDVAMALCTTKALKEEQNLYIEFFTDPIYRDLVKACPYVDCVITDHEEIQALLRVPDSEHIQIKDLGSVWHGTCGIHEIDSFFQELRTYTSNSNKQLEINIPQEIIDKIKTIADHTPLLKIRFHGPPKFRQRQILIHPGISDPSRTWPIKYWNSLTDSLIELGHKVIIIGAKHCDGKDVLKINNSDVLDLTNQLSFLETIALMRCSDDLISTDSGPIQLAGTSDIRIIGIYSVVNPECRLPYRHGELGWNAIGIKPECEHSPCFLSLHNKKLFNELKYIKNNKVDFHNTLKNWCINEDRFCCMKQITPDKILRYFK